MNVAMKVAVWEMMVDMNQGSVGVNGGMKKAGWGGMMAIASG